MLTYQQRKYSYRHTTRSLTLRINRSIRKRLTAMDYLLPIVINN